MHGTREIFIVTTLYILKWRQRNGKIVNTVAFFRLCPGEWAASDDETEKEYMFTIMQGGVWQRQRRLYNRLNEWNAYGFKDLYIAYRGVYTLLVYAAVAFSSAPASDFNRNSRYSFGNFNVCSNGCWYTFAIKPLKSAAQNDRRQWRMKIVFTDVQVLCVSLNQQSIHYIYIYRYVYDVHIIIKIFLLLLHVIICNEFQMLTTTDQNWLEKVTKSRFENCHLMFLFYSPPFIRLRIHHKSFCWWRHLPLLNSLQRHDRCQCLGAFLCSNRES